MHAFRSWFVQDGWRWLAGCLGLLLIAGLTLACATRAALRREAARGPRDLSGIMAIAAARDLDPPPEWFATHPECHGRASEAVLLIHGFVGGPNEYADLGERIAAQGYHVRMMRLPGHGTTPQDFGKQTTDTLYTAVREEYSALRREYPRVTVGGFSMGGALATLLASETDVHRLMLFSPYFGVTYRWFYLLPAERWNALFCPVFPYVIKSERFVQVNRRESVPDIYTYHVVPTKGVNTLIATGTRARDPRVLSQISCPVLLLAAAGDIAASPARIKDVYKQLPSPDKQQVWFSEKINHQIFWDWEAEKAKQIVLDWLGSAATSREKQFRT